MRHIPRKPLSDDALAALGKFQGEADLLAANNPKINTLWSTKRRTKAFDSVKDQLGEMAGDAKRCMYCEDSEGSDIEHFWPKSAYPGKMFRWENYLLGCGICNRNKGDQFPVDKDNKPMLIDPTVEEPWDFLDYDPELSQIMARFDLASNQPSHRGEVAVKILKLNREAVGKMYRRTYRRLKERLELFLKASTIGASELARELKSYDDHHLLGWCFIGAGRNVSPWKEFKEQHSEVWEECRRILFPTKG